MKLSEGFLRPRLNLKPLRNDDYDILPAGAKRRPAGFVSLDSGLVRHKGTMHGVSRKGENSLWYA